MELLIFYKDKNLKKLILYLNSNMELLISKIKDNCVSATTFKFQYGATNIHHLWNCKYFEKQFKFQYGATNIGVLTPIPKFDGVI